MQKKNPIHTTNLKLLTGVFCRFFEERIHFPLHHDDLEISNGSRCFAANYNLTVVSDSKIKAISCSALVVALHMLHLQKHEESQ